MRVKAYSADVLFRSARRRIVASQILHDRTMAALGEHKVRREGDTVVKRARRNHDSTSEKKKLYVESKKLIAAGRVASGSREFVVPELIDMTDDPKLTMSLLPEFVTLRDLEASDPDALLGWFETAGKALHEIHDRVAPEDLARRQLPFPELRCAGPEVWIHGDYTKSNVGVCLDGGRETLGIVDWQTTEIMGGDATVAPAYFDVAWFISGLFIEPPHKLLRGTAPEDKASAFLSGYAVASASFNHDAFVVYSLALLRERKARLGVTHRRYKRAGLRVGLRRWRNWIDSEGPKMTTTRDYRTSHLGDKKAARYHDGFSANPYRAMMWELEREVLEELVQGVPRTNSLLDFATGSGRVLQLLEERFEKSVGIDISRSMLDIASKVVVSSELVVGDLTTEPLLGDQLFDVVTAFRFFPNAQPDLRREAMEALLPHLAPDGRLILNNHKNSKSMVYGVAKLLRMNRKKPMSYQEVEKLASTHDLEIVEIVGLGVFPSTEKFRLLPTRVLVTLERKLSSVKALQRIAVNHIFVLKRR